MDTTAVIEAPARSDKRLSQLPGFRPLIWTYSINDIGDLLAMVALAVFVYDTTESPYALAAMFGASKLVPALVSPWVTARLATRRVGRTLPILYSVEAALFALLAILVAADAPLGWLLALAAVDGLLALTGRSLTRGVMAKVFDDGEMLRAGNAFVSQLNAWLLVLATAGAYVLIELTSPLTALWLDVGTFVVAASIVGLSGRSLPAPEVDEDDDAPRRGRTREGLRHVWRRPRARSLVIGEGLAMTLGSLVVPVEVIYASESLDAGPSAYGLLYAAWGLGSIVGATYFKRNHERNLAMIVAGAAIVCGVGYLGLAAAPTLAFALVASVIGGAGNGAEWVGVMTALQEDVESEFYARASGLLESIATGGPALAFAGGAAITAAIGPRYTFLIGGIAGVAVGIYWLFRPVADAPSPAPPPAASARKPVIGTIPYAIAAGLSIVVVVLLGLHESWQPDLLVGLVALAIGLAPLAIERDGTSINGGAVTVVLAACVLGPAQAALVGLAGISADLAWYRYQTGMHVRARAVLTNIVTYSMFPVTGGLVAAAVFTPDHGMVAFIASVTLVYLAVLLSNLAMMAVYSWSEYGLSPSASFTVGPTLWAEVLAAELSAFGVWALLNEQLLGLLIAAISLVVFIQLARRFYESVDNAIVAEEKRQEAEEQRSLAEHRQALVAYSQRFTIVKIMHALAAKDASTARHSAAVSGYMRAFAEHLDLDEDGVRFCGVAGLLHDNGKLSVPDAILNKPGRLTDEEMDLIRRHAQDGADFVRDLDGFGDISDVIVAHHERWDGRGYPNGLKGEAIPTVSMMINICDAYDVLTSRSLYSEPKPHDQVIEILLGDRGTILNSYLVDQFVAMMQSRPGLRYNPDQGNKFDEELQLFLGERPPLAPEHNF